MATKKTCSTCGQLKPPTAFYKHPHGKNGRMAQCAECNKSIHWARYHANKDRYKIKALEWRQSARGKQITAQLKRASIAKHPERRKAHLAVKRAIYNGELIPLPCLVCGDKAEAHHPDYSEPLMVTWLCQEHHREVHQIARSVNA